VKKRAGNRVHHATERRDLPQPTPQRKKKKYHAMLFVRAPPQGEEKKREPGRVATLKNRRVPVFIAADPEGKKRGGKGRAPLLTSLPLGSRRTKKRTSAPNSNGGGHAQAYNDNAAQADRKEGKREGEEKKKNNV